MSSSNKESNSDGRKNDQVNDVPSVGKNSERLTFKRKRNDNNPKDIEFFPCVTYWKPPRGEDLVEKIKRSSPHACVVVVDESQKLGMYPSCSKWLDLQKGYIRYPHLAIPRKKCLNGGKDDAYDAVYRYIIDIGLEMETATVIPPPSCFGQEPPNTSLSDAIMKSRTTNTRGGRGGRSHVKSIKKRVPKIGGRKENNPPPAAMAVSVILTWRWYPLRAVCEVFGEYLMFLVNIH